MAGPQPQAWPAWLQQGSRDHYDNIFRHTQRLEIERETERERGGGVASWSWQGHAYIPQAKALHIVPLWCKGWCMTFTGLGETWPPFFLFGWTVISSSKLNTTLTLQVLISFKNRASWALPFQVKFVSKLSFPSCMGNACMNLKRGA